MVGGTSSEGGAGAGEDEVVVEQRLRQEEKDQGPLAGSGDSP
jgi:hypothetical protein